MYNGAHDSIAALLFILCRCLADHGPHDTKIPQRMVARQLEAEYGVALDPAPIFARRNSTNADTINVRNVQPEEVARVQAALEKCTILQR